jgi:hypothetical protein
MRLRVMIWSMAETEYRDPMKSGNIKIQILQIDLKVG